MESEKIKPQKQETSIQIVLQARQKQGKLERPSYPISIISK